MELAMMIMGMLPSLIKVATDIRNEAVRTNEWTPEQVAAFDAAKNAMFASPAWKVHGPLPPKPQ
jgi:hypothetical protein